MPHTESDLPIPLPLTFPPHGNSGVIILGILMKTLSTAMSTSTSTITVFAGVDVNVDVLVHVDLDGFLLSKK